MPNDESDLEPLREIKDRTGWTPDGKWRNTWVEIKDGVHNARDLRSTLFNLAYAVKADPGSDAIAVLMNSRISLRRLEDELAMFSGVASPELVSRIKVLHCQDPADAYACTPDIGFARWLEELMRKHQSNAGKSATKHSVAGLIYLLILRRSEPLTAAQIGEMAGASHPTVAHVLKLMEQQGAIHRENGIVRFDRFQMFPWTRWLNLEVGTRKRVSFVDVSGQARSPESMARRLERMNLTNVAVGGLLGAKHYFPSLDLAGTTRLDLVVHGTPSTSLSFVEELDPALARSKDANLQPSVVVHFLPRAKAFFEEDQSGNRWADPIVCMADLQEAGFDQLAEELLQKLAFNRS